MRTPNASDLVNMLPRERWINVTEELDRLFPQADTLERKQIMSKANQRLNRMFDWGEVDKQGQGRRVTFFIPDGVMA